MTALESNNDRTKYCVRKRRRRTPFALPTKVISSWLTYKNILRARSEKVRRRLAVDDLW